MNAHSGVRADIADRIMAAADQLYEQHGRTTIPTVDQVRRHAKANMHDVTLLMREWRLRPHRHSETIQTIPDHLQRAANDALASVWQAACDTAKTTLSAERAAWEQERVEADQLRHELAEACEAALQEQNRLAVSRQQLEQQLASLDERHRQTEQALVEAIRERDVAVAIHHEVQQHLDDMRLQLQRIHAVQEKPQAASNASRQRRRAQVESSAPRIGVMDGTGPAPAGTQGTLDMAGAGPVRPRQSSSKKQPEK
jgi:colicin import membrane protein